MSYNLLISFIVSFTVTFTVTPWLIKKLRDAGITGKDMNKSDKPEIPEMGGIAVVIGFFVGVYSLIAMYDIFDIGREPSTFLMASLMTIIGIAFVGMLDDLLDISQRMKAVLPFLFALPLGIYVSRELSLPIFGNVNFGYFMLFLIPLGVTCAANSANMLEGFNGLGTGLGIIITISLIIMSYLNDVSKGMYLLIPLLGCLIAFLYYNRFPAKIFPGDTLTIFMGGAIACSSFLSNLKLECFFLLCPMIVEFFLKLRGRFEGECFAKATKNGVLIHKGRIESLTHLIMEKFVVSEKKLVYIFWGFESFLAIVVINLSYLKVI